MNSQAAGSRIDLPWATARYLLFDDGGVNGTKIGAQHGARGLIWGVLRPMSPTPSECPRHAGPWRRPL